MTHSFLRAIGKAVTSVMAVFLVSSFSVNTSISFAQTNTPKPKINVYLALGDKHQFPRKEPKTNFACDDKIFSVIELSNFKQQRYEFSVSWIDPAGVERERTQYPFSVNNTETRLWSWLSLSRARGAGMLQWINPAAGLEEFIGPWKIEIRINDKKIAERTFEVTC